MTLSGEIEPDQPVGLERPVLSGAASRHNVAGRGHLAHSRHSERGSLEVEVFISTTSQRIGEDGR